MDNRVIKLVAAGDGNAMAGLIAGAFEQTPALTLDRDLTHLPDEHSTSVLVFLCTEEALGDPLGELVYTAIRRHLGLEPFRRDCRLFISYRRSDGSATAQAIYRHFRNLGYDAFLDTEDEAIEPGEAVQPRIAQAIPERDFLLLIDSPDAADSPWVREEVTIALENRVAIFGVRVSGSEGFPQVRGLPSLEWRDEVDACLRDLERYVASKLAARRSFDRRLQQSLAKFKLLAPVQIAEQGRRRLLLKIGAATGTIRCLLDFEDASYDLTRLYRLSRGCAALSGQIDHGLLVHRGRRLSDEECQAVDWAKGSEPLQVLALDQVVSHLSNLIQPAT